MSAKNTRSLFSPVRAVVLLLFGGILSGATTTPSQLARATLLPTHSAPQADAPPPSTGPRIYVTNKVTLLGIEPLATEASTSLSLGTGTGFIAVSPDGSRAYVPLSTNTIAVVDVVANALVASIPVGANPIRAVLSPDGSTCYVANRLSNTVSVISTATNQVVATVPVGIRPYGVAVSRDGSRVYVANITSNSISVIDAATRQVVRTFTDQLALPFALVVTNDGGRLFVVNDMCCIKVIDTATGIATKTIGVYNVPFGLIEPHQSCLKVYDAQRCHGNHGR
jgi:YVTN family beta-propeller protein